MTRAVSETKHVTYLVVYMCMCHRAADEQRVDRLIDMPSVHSRYMGCGTGQGREGYYV
jgi:hypothetical protein